MANTGTHPENLASNGRLPGTVMKNIATMVTAFTAWRRSVATRKAIDDLSYDQLRDIGCSEIPVSRFVVRGALITNLMSMR